ncbi:MAG TPA: cadmium resistance transporter [Trebonia sp.]|nr:cadmium resistance transporter [Trebonia sp.]
MDTLPATVGTAVGLFAGTNIDDMIVLTVLSASSRATGRPGRWEIWAGQYAGIAILVAVSLAASRGLDLIPQGWLWLLGLIPLSLGIYRLAAAIRARRRGERPPAPAPGGLPGVAGLTVANGGDNVAAYTPVFATISAAATAVTIAVFAACVAVWCLTGAWLVSHHRVTEALQRYGHWIIPVVYILIGLYIFKKEDALSHLR